jgi:hypothetical protein
MRVARYRLEPPAWYDREATISLVTSELQQLPEISRRR